MMASFATYGDSTKWFGGRRAHASLCFMGNKLTGFIEVIARFPAGTREQAFRAGAIHTWVVARSLSGSAMMEWMQKAQAGFDIDSDKSFDRCGSRWGSTANRFERLRSRSDEIVAR
jgi:hypothetical protein